MISRSGLLAVLCGTAMVAILLGAGPIAAGENVPFKGYGVSVFTGFEPPNVGIFALTSGQSTHMGTLEGSARVYFTPLPSDADVVLVAANGDKVLLTAHGDPDETGAFVGSYTITGGTGRFEGATGTGDWKVVETGIDEVTAYWDGNISY